jgi:hypothetical protein
LKMIATSQIIKPDDVVYLYILSELAMYTIHAT